MKNKQVTLKLFQCCYPAGIGWELVNVTETIYVTSYTPDSYKHKVSAKRAADRTAKMLGLEIVNYEQDI